MTKRLWKETTLGEHVEIKTGFPFKSERYTDELSGIRLLRGDNIIQGQLRWDGVKRWPADAALVFEQFALATDDIVLAMDRPWIEAGLKYAWIKNRDLPCLLVQRVSRIRGRSELTTPFLRYIVGHHDFADYLKGVWTGVAVPHISESQIRAFRFYLPPIRIQQDIVHILSAYDDLIENNTWRIKILEDIAQMIFREWFVHFRFPGHENVRMVESELGLIPEGWVARAVIHSIFLNPPTTIPKSGGKPFLPMSSLSSSSMVIGNIERKEGNSGAKFKNGDTLFARITPCLENGKTGFVQFLPSDDVVACGSTEFIVLRSKHLCPEYVYLMARSEEFRNHAIKSMSGATGRQRVQEACFQRFLIAEPKERVLKAFRHIASPLFKLIHVLSSKNTNLRATRDFLLPKLISGEISVEAAEETAAEFLKQTA